MYPFLLPANRRDAAGRRPDHPDHDPSTLQLPRGFPKVTLGNGETKVRAALTEPYTPLGCIWVKNPSLVMMI